MRRCVVRILLASLLVLFSVALLRAQPQVGIVTALNANLRETPSPTGEVKQQVPSGSEIRVLDKKGAWYVVRIADAVGWMHGNTFQLEGSASEELAPSVVSPVDKPPARQRRTEPAITAPSPSSSSGYLRGPRGGCYYLSRSGRKVYVDRSLCN